MATCGAPNRWPPYGVCQRPVVNEGDRCHDHKGFTTYGKSQSRRHRKTRYSPSTWSSTYGTTNWQPVPSPPASPVRSSGPRYRPAGHPFSSGELTAAEQRRVDEAVTLCVNIGLDGWEEVVSGRVADCLTDATFRRLFKHRSGNCRFLADLAKAILKGKEKMHEIIGGIGSWVAGKFGAEPIERTVARELARRIRIPVVDEKVIVVARGLQMIGILYCLAGNIPLSRCPSFIDLARAETKERVKEILEAAMEDWTHPSDEMIVAWTGRPSHGRTSMTPRP